MTNDLHPIGPQMQAAIAELHGLILEKFPDTTFDTGEADEHGVVFVRAVVNVDDPDKVKDVFIDRMVDLLVDDGLAIYIVPVRAPAREAAERQRQQQRNAWAISV